MWTFLTNNVGLIRTVFVTLVSLFTIWGAVTYKAGKIEARVAAVEEKIKGIEAIPTDLAEIKGAVKAILAIVRKE